MEQSSGIGPSFFLDILVESFGVVVPQQRMTWPFVTHPVFSELSNPVAEQIIFCPLDGLPAASPTVNNDDGGNLPFFCPAWQGLVDESLVNLDLLSIPDVANAVSTGIDVSSSFRVPHTGFEPFNSTTLDNGLNYSWLIHPIRDTSNSQLLLGLAVGYMPDSIANKQDYAVAAPLANTLSSVLPAYATTKGETFPFVTSSLFSLLASRIIDFSFSPNTKERVLYCPLVESSQRMEWEAYAAENFRAWVPRPSNDNITEAAETAATATALPFVYRLAEDGSAVAEDASTQQSTLYCPIWQHWPLQPAAAGDSGQVAGVVAENFNLFSTAQLDLSLAEQLNGGFVLEFLAGTGFPLGGPGRPVRVQPILYGSNTVVGLLVLVAAEEKADITTPPTPSTTTLTPASLPTVKPTSTPTRPPTTRRPSTLPSKLPSLAPSWQPSTSPSTALPNEMPLTQPTVAPAISTSAPLPSVSPTSGATSTNKQSSHSSPPARDCTFAGPLFTLLVCAALARLFH